MFYIGHRGARGLFKKSENTILSFEKALELGANAIECDARRTKDGKIVLMHDLAIDRTTNGIGKISDFTYEELQKFNVGEEEKIPLLFDIIVAFNGKCLIDIEIKEKDISEGIRKIILENKAEKGVMVSAFDYDDVDFDATSSWDDLKIMHPEIQTALLATPSKIQKLGNIGLMEHAKSYGAKAIRLHFSSVDKELIDCAHKNDVLVFVWTVNDIDNMKKFVELGVDGIMSDFPNLFNDMKKM